MELPPEQLLLAAQLLAGLLEELTVERPAEPRVELLAAALEALELTLLPEAPAEILVWSPVAVLPAKLVGERAGKLVAELVEIPEQQRPLALRRPPVQPRVRLQVQHLAPRRRLVLHQRLQ